MRNKVIELGRLILRKNSGVIEVLVGIDLHSELVISDHSGTLLDSVSKIEKQLTEKSQGSSKGKDHERALFLEQLLRLFEQYEKFDPEIPGVEKTISELIDKVKEEYDADASLKSFFCKHIFGNDF